MANAILVHGYCDEEKYLRTDRPAMSESNWLPWLKTELCKRGILTANPEFPEPWQPDYKSWLREFERFPVDENTILVGHSYGGGFLARWLSETDKKVAKIVLVAPYMGTNLATQLPPEVLAKYDFFKFNLRENPTEITKSLTIFKSTNDNPALNDGIDNILMKSWGYLAKLVTLENRGHFTTDQKWTKFEFPELLEEIINE
jgi:predicted alpha/beta hydrolase family esterase